jgi:hypothetical protein
MWQKGKSEQFSSDARFVPFRVTSNAGLGQIPRELAHLEGQKKTLFARHRTLNPELNLSRRGIGIGERHGRMLSRRLSLTCPMMTQVS